MKGNPTVKTENGISQLEPVFCEVTGELLCWKTWQPDESYIKGITPAFLSLDVVNEDGKQLIPTEDIRTF